LKQPYEALKNLTPHPEDPRRILVSSHLHIFDHLFRNTNPNYYSSFLHGLSLQQKPREIFHRLFLTYRQCSFWFQVAAQKLHNINNRNKSSILGSYILGDTSDLNILSSLKKEGETLGIARDHVDICFQPQRLKEILIIKDLCERFDAHSKEMEDYLMKCDKLPFKMDPPAYEYWKTFFNLCESAIKVRKWVQIKDSPKNAEEDKILFSVIKEYFEFPEFFENLSETNILQEKYPYELRVSIIGDLLLSFGQFEDFNKIILERPWGPWKEECYNLFDITKGIHDYCEKKKIKSKIKPFDLSSSVFGHPLTGV